MFRSYLISMVVFAGIVSIMLACLKREQMREIVRYAVKNFLYMTGGAVIASWFIYLF